MSSYESLFQMSEGASDIPAMASLLDWKDKSVAGTRVNVYALPPFCHG
jgi:hypothetical protein